MFNLIFGLFITIFISLASVEFFRDITWPIPQEQLSNELIFPILALLLFLVIGLYLICIGIRKIIRDKETELNGEICYGKITKIYESGESINGIPILQADVDVYIPSTNEIKKVSEKLRLRDRDYRVGYYVKTKYYNGDINFVGNMNDENVPSNIIEKLENA